MATYTMRTRISFTKIIRNCKLNKVLYELLQISHEFHVIRVEVFVEIRSFEPDNLTITSNLTSLMRPQYQ